MDDSVVVAGTTARKVSRAQIRACCCNCCVPEVRMRRRASTARSNGLAEPPAQARRLKRSASMIVLGIVLLVLGIIASLPILVTLGIVLIVVGLVLELLGATGRAVGGRRHYY